MDGANDRRKTCRGPEDQSLLITRTNKPVQSETQWDIAAGKAIKILIKEEGGTAYASRNWWRPDSILRSTRRSCNFLWMARSSHPRHGTNDRRFDSRTTSNSMQQDSIRPSQTRGPTTSWRKGAGKRIKNLRPKAENFSQVISHFRSDSEKWCTISPRSKMAR